MKYFVRKREWRGNSKNTTYEITHKYARKLYKGASKTKHDNLTAGPDFNAGKKVGNAFWTVWGEIITNKECFRRRLKGELAKGKLKERILDNE